MWRSSSGGSLRNEKGSMALAGGGCGPESLEESTMLGESIVSELYTRMLFAWERLR